MSYEEEEAKSRRRSLNYLHNKFLDGKISEHEYMEALDTQYDILTKLEREELDKWEKEDLRKHNERNGRKMLEQQKRNKEGEQIVYIIFIILSLIVGILMLVTRS